MQNNNNACYANSVFQCLANVKCINECVLKKGPRTTLKTAFSNYFNPLLLGTNLDISDLRSEFFHNLEQQDSGEFLRLLLNSDHSKDMRDLCKHDLVSYVRCSNSDCNDHVGREVDRHDNIVCPLSLYGLRKCKIIPLINMNFDNWQNAQQSKCDGCGSALQNKMNVENPRSVLIFSLSIANDFYIKTNSFELSSVQQTTISLGSKNYVLSGAVFHHGKGMREGHYTAVLRKNGKFYRANDETISKCSWPRLSKDAYLLFYVEK